MIARARKERGEEPSLCPPYCGPPNDYPEAPQPFAPRFASESTSLSSTSNIVSGFTGRNWAIFVPLGGSCNLSSRSPFHRRCVHVERHRDIHLSKTPRVDYTGGSLDSLQSHARPILDARAIGRIELDCDSGADQRCPAGSEFHLLTGVRIVRQILAWPGR